MEEKRPLVCTRNIVLAAIALVAVVLLGYGGWSFMSRKNERGPPQQNAQFEEM